MSIDMFLIKYIGRVGLYGIAIAVILICGMLVVNTPLSRAYSSYKQKKLDKQAEIKAKRAEEMALHQWSLRLEKRKELSS